MNSKLRDGEIIPLTYDYVFVSIFNNEKNIDIIENFVSTCLDLDRESIRGKLKILNRDLELDSKSERRKRVDLLLDYNGEKINIELNGSNSMNVIERNIVYACNVHGRQLRYGDNNYTGICKTIQININTNIRNNNEIKQEYLLKDEYNNTLSSKFKIIMIDISKGIEMCYNGTQERLAYWCYTIASKSKNEFNKYLGEMMENKEAKKLENEVNKYSSDDEVYELYSAYTKDELEKNTLLIEAKEQGLEQGLKEGIEQGLEQGIEQTKKQSAIKLYNNGVSKEIICKSLDIKEDDLKEYIKT